MSSPEPKSVFIGRETMVRRDEVGGILPSTELDSDLSRDELDDGDNAGSGFDAEDQTMNDLTTNTPEPEREVSRAASEATNQQPGATGGGNKQRGRPRGRPRGTKGSRAQVKAPAGRRSNRIRSAVTPFAPAAAHPKPQRRVAGKKKGPKPGKEWEVDRIIDSVIERSTLRHYYLVKWKGFDSKQNTWEPKKNLAKCSAAIIAYEEATMADGRAGRRVSSV